MKQQEVFNKLGGIITEINEQYEYLQSTNGVSNDLELELLAANAHFLSDHIEILRKINAHAEKAQPVPTPPTVIEEKITLEPAVAIPVMEDKPAVEPRYFEPVMEPEEEPVTAQESPDEAAEAQTVEFEIGNRAIATEAIETEPEPEIIPEPEAQPVTIRHELTLEDIGEDWDEDDEVEDIDLEPEPINAEAIPGIVEFEPEPIKPEPEPTPAPVATQPEAKPEPILAPVVPIAAQVKVTVEEEPVLTLNQRMSAQMATSRMSDHLSAKPITDLKGAITLNDKMLYIKDLFNGYSLAYSEALDLLNRMKSFEEAEAFLNNSYATKNNWADKQATADKFYALLQRRYI